MSYSIDQQNIFSILFETHLSSIVKDEKPTNAPAYVPYSLGEAQTRYKEILGNEKAEMALFFNQQTEFKFNNYSKDGYYENPEKKELTFPLVRKFSSDTFKNAYKGESESLTSTNKLTVQLNYQIIKKGFNFGDTGLAQRNKNKKKLNELLEKGKIIDGKENVIYDSNKKLFPRILKIMSFILARERGQDPNAHGSSEELMHREYGLICWSIVNAAAKGKFSCGNNILKLLQNNAYTNPKQKDETYHISDKNDVIDDAETTVMQGIYTTRAPTSNLQLFVMAFWDGYINEELPGVTNWDHVSSKGENFVFRGFHLPNSLKNTPDPDEGLSIDIFIKNNNQTFPHQKIEAGQTFNITNTSNGDTYTLDGNVLFTIN